MITKKIVNKGETINVKRFYIEEVKTQCPNCGSDKAIILGESYLSYPKIGKKEEAWGLCSDCKCSFTVPIKLELKIEYDMNEANIEEIEED